MLDFRAFRNSSTIVLTVSDHPVLHAPSFLYKRTPRLELGQSSQIAGRIVGTLRTNPLVGFLRRSLVNRLIG